MKDSYHLAIDLGATSGRAILARFDGARVEIEEVSRFHYPMLPIAGHLFWNLPQIFQEAKSAIDTTIEKLGAEGRRLGSIGIDSWGCDVAYFNSDGSLAGLPYCYRDTHTAGAAAEFGKKMPAVELYRRTGIQFMDFNTIFQLDKIRPEADRILWIPDALAYMLTGNAVTEYTVASTSQMLNLATGELDGDILKILGLRREQFGPMVRPGTAIGYYREVLVKAIAGHDTASAVIGIPSPDRNFAYLSCGTWSLLGVESPVPNSGEKAFRYNFTNEGGIAGTTRLLKNICGMWIFERVRHEFGMDNEDVGKLAAMWKESECDTIINPDDAAFANPGSMRKAIARYCVEHCIEAPESLADYIRVTYRSLAARVALQLERLRELSPVEITRLHVIGGGSRNESLMQMLATATGLPVIAGPAESTALGNILVQILDEDLQNIRQIAINSTKTIKYKP